MVKDVKLDINKAMSICLRNKYKVQVVPVGSQFAIEVLRPDCEPERYEKLVSAKEVATAHRKTYIAWAKHILKQEKDAKSTNAEAKTVAR